MRNIVTQVWNVITNRDNIRMTRRQRYIEDYLSQSVDRVDLERRERELTKQGYLR